MRSRRSGRPGRVGHRRRKSAASAGWWRSGQQCGGQVQVRCRGILVTRSRTEVCTLADTYPIGYIQRVDAVLHALSDSSRRTVLEVLRQGDATVGELAALLPIARPGVSRHLRVLREAGLVEVRQEAQWRVYSLRPEPLAEVDDWIGRYRSLWEHRLNALHTEVARGKKNRRSNR
jgi:DNA-binding transcriptional ArsR family regulator